MNTWQPASESKVRSLFATEQTSFNATEAKLVDYLGIGFEKFLIKRNERTEEVFAVLKSNNLVIYYDDIESGWEIGKIDFKGVITEYGASQWDLRATMQHFIKAIS